MDSPKNPLISIIVPCYNHASFLTASLTSILKQTYSTFEVLLVNDGSTDETPRIFAEWEKKDPRFRAIHQENQEEVNQGLAVARNRGIKEAKGTYIALLDSDDLMQPDRLQKQLAYLQNNGKIDFLYTSVEVINEQGKPLGILKKEPIPPENFLAVEFFRHQIPTPSTLMGKAALFRNTPFDKRFRLGEDYEWTLRAAHRFIFDALPLPLTQYRRHASNMSENLQKLREAELEVLRDHGYPHILTVVEKSHFKPEEKELLKGKILYVMGEYAEAIEHLSPLKNPIAFFYLGNCYFEEQKLKECQESYELALPSSNPALYNNWGVCLTAGLEDTPEDKEKAEQNFKQALTLKPGYLDPQKNLAALKEGHLPKSFTRRELRDDLLPYISL